MAIVLPENLNHHAYVIEGSFNCETLRTFILNMDVCFSFENMGIDDARQIKQLASQKNDQARLMVVTADSITHQAQNALLKTFEEPGENNHFMLVIPNVDTLLPTLQSRLQVIENSSNTSAGAIDAQDFLDKNVQERMKWIDGMFGKKGTGMTKSDAIQMMNNLERVIHVDINRPDRSDHLQLLLQSKKYLNQNGASIKMILENVALVV